MLLQELLLKYRFTTEEGTELYVFIDFSLNYDRPLKMKRLADNNVEFFGFDEIFAEKSQFSTIEMEQLSEQLNSSNNHHKEVEKQRLDEWNKLNNRLKITSTDIDNIIEFFDEMSIDLIKKQLKRLSNKCNNSSY